MLSEKTKTYQLTIEEYKMFKDDIIEIEKNKGYELIEDKLNDDYLFLTFGKPLPNEKDYYDVFVKWNDSEEEKPYCRKLNINEMESSIEYLLRIRKNHFRFPKTYKRYPEYVRVE